MANPGEYQSILQEARRIALALSDRGQQRILDLLREWQEELAIQGARAAVTGNTSGLRRIIREMADQLQRELRRDVEDLVGQTARRMASLHTEATMELARDEELPNAVIREAFSGIGTSAAQAVLSREELSAAFVNVRDDAVEAADAVLLEGIVRGRSPEQIAQQLRLYITGSGEFPDSALLDRRTIGFDTLRQMGLEANQENLRMVRQRAASVSSRSMMITRTEIMNAEHEAGIQAGIESPVVQAVKWFLSNRHPEYDECDLLAKQNLYGLGAGMYPPERVPQRPHPNGLCGRRHALRPVEEWGTPRGPTPGLRVDPLQVALSDERLTPSSREAYVNTVNRARQRPAA